MQITVNKSDVNGLVQAPSSKSYTIRALMCSALAPGRSQIRAPLLSDDTEAALRVLEQIGVKTHISQEKWEIEGGNFKTPLQDLYCGDSAATLRFMSAICAKVPGPSRLTAGPSLSKRPVDKLVLALNQWGIAASCHGETAPVVVKGGEFRGGTTRVPGDISSQYISALLLIAGQAEKRATIWLTTPLESRSYVLMTLECLRRFGITVKYGDELMEYEIPPQEFIPADYQVEGDWSSASYLVGLGAVAGESQVSNLNQQSLQGDKIIVDLLERMGAVVSFSDSLVTVSQRKLKAIKTDLNESIDLLPTIAVLAALAEGTSELSGIQRARLKESNRIAAVREGLEKTGINVVEEPNKLTITGGKPIRAIIDSKNDHRIAMAFSLMGASAGGITIEGAECVNKTYPEFWKTIRNLGVKINEQ
jgi:3-phosphoshikimate 1-carboxyvinyltransferase